MNETAPLQKGQLFADVYKVIRQIGQGAKGTVYEAEHLALSKSVALKIFPSEVLSDPDSARRFQNEAKAIASLNHDNIVKAHAAGIWAGNIPFIATELVEGKTLEELLAVPPGYLKQEQLLCIFNQVFDALAYAHDEGIVHRDLKPSNIMVTNSGTLKILDFGIAKFISTKTQDKTATRMIVGSPAYMSPEQSANKAIDSRSDIYTLGVLLFRCASGKLPFEADSDLAMMYQHQHAAPLNLVLPSDSDLNSKNLIETVNRCLEKDPEKRYQDVIELQNAFNERVTDVSSFSKSDGKYYLANILGACIVAGILAALIALLGLYNWPLFQSKVRLVFGTRLQDQALKERLTPSEANERENDHRTSQGKISLLQSNNIEDLIWRARNFYHSSEHKDTAREKLEASTQSITTYDRVLALLAKRPDRYLYYLTYVGKARALIRRLHAEQLVGPVPDERIHDIHRQRIELLMNARKQVPAESYEASVIARELGCSFYVIGSRKGAADKWYHAIALREREVEWSPDSLKYVHKADFKEDDNPVSLLLTYQALKKFERERKNSEAEFNILKRYFEMAKDTEEASEPAYFNDLDEYPVYLYLRGKKQEAYAVIDILHKIANTAKLPEHGSEDKLTLAETYRQIKDKQRANQMLDEAEKDIASLRDSGQRNDLMKRLRTLKQSST